MALVPDPATKGLWCTQPPRAAGMHALIIGISDYPHLADGSGVPWADNGGMGQLEVCAKSAARIFDWVRNAGAIAGAPVATCRLLLGPRPGEQAEVTALTGGEYADTSFASVRTATEAWRDSIYAGATQEAPNVALFYFSGHGLEHVASPSVLCRDILNPASPAGPKNALSFNSLWQSVKTYGVDRALFFVDACRNTPELARTLHIVGTDVLEPGDYPPRRPDAVVWLQATRDGAFAYQLPGADATFFGKALLEGLTGMPPDALPYDRSTAPWKLLFANLESYVRRRVIELLKDHSTRTQMVQPSGDPYNGDVVVAEKPGAAVGEPLPRLVLSHVAPAPEFGFELALTGLNARSNAVLSSFDKIDGVARGDLTDYSIMHKILRHEEATWPWVNTVKILDVASEQPVAPSTVTMVEGQSQERGDTLTAWADIRVEPDAGQAIWIQAGGFTGESRFAVAIPRDLFTPIPVRLDVVFRRPPPNLEYWTLEAMSARLSEPLGDAPELARIWNPLWQAQRVEALFDFANASRIVDSVAEDLEKTLMWKRTSPVGAAIAGGLLLRAGALDQLHDWPRNLADLFPWLADGPVLWSEALLRRSERDHKTPRPAATAAGHPADLAARKQRLAAIARLSDHQEAAKYFARIAERGPPLLTASLVAAARQAQFWRQVLETDTFSGGARTDLTAACDAIDRAASRAVSNSLFAGFVSQKEPLTPSVVIDPPPKPRA